MALAIDASSPVLVSVTTNAGTSASFTPPASSLLVILWAGNTPVTFTPVTPTITDNLGVHLTYTQQVWERRANTFAADGEVAIWTAPVASSAAMTITISNNSTAGNPDHAFRIMVLTDSSQPTVGAVAKNGQNSGTTVAATYTATQTGSWGFSAVSDWDEKGAETAGAGTTLLSSANSASAQISFGFFRRTSADGTNGSATTVNTTLPLASTNIHWGAIEIKAAAAGASPVVTFAPKRRRVGAPPRKVIGYQSRSVTPVCAQLNPPFIPVETRGQRRYLTPTKRGKSSQVVLPQFNPPYPTIEVRGLRRYLLPARRATAAQVTPAQVIVSTAPAITATTLARVRRALGPYRRRAVTGAPLAGQDVPPGTWRRVRPQALSRRLRAQASPVALQHHSLTARATGRLRALGRIRAPGRVSTPVPTQQAPAVNPSITATVFGRLRTVGRIRAPYRVSNPTPPQQAATPNPSITATVFGRLRTVGRIRAPYRVSNPTPPQQAATPNPAITATVFGRLRTVGRIRPRAKVNNPVPAQQAATPNPAITATVFGRLRTVGRIQPRAKVSSPVALQHHAPTPKAFGRLRTVGRTNRIPRVAKPIPAQVNPTYPIRPSVGGLSGLRRVWLKIRRKNAYPVPGQVTTLSGPLTISDSHGGVEADRGAGTVIGGTYGSAASSSVSKGSSGGFSADPDTDNVAPTYDSDSDSL